MRDMGLSLYLLANTHAFNPVVLIFLYLHTEEAGGEYMEGVAKAIVIIIDPSFA